MTRIRLQVSLFFILNGGIAQLARASALQAEGPGFESLCLQIGLSPETVLPVDTGMAETPSVVKAGLGAILPAMRD